MKTVKVWITVRNFVDNEEIRVFDSYDEIFGVYDYSEEVVMSQTTYNRLREGYTPVRYGNTIRAFSF